MEKKKLLYIWVQRKTLIILILNSINKWSYLIVVASRSSIILYIIDPLYIANIVGTPPYFYNHEYYQCRLFLNNVIKYIYIVLLFKSLN